MDIRIPNGVLTVGGSVQIMRVDGEDFLFEMHDYCGPIVVNKDWSEKKKQPAQNSSFWSAVKLWENQGRQVIDGVCVWKLEPVPLVRMLDRRHGVVIGEAMPACVRQKYVYEEDKQPKP